MEPRLHVAVTDDLADFPPVRRALKRLELDPWVSCEFVSLENGELVLEDTTFDAALVFGARVTARSLPPSLKLIARVGVGYENVDVAECHRRGVYVTITPDAVRMPMASGGVAMLLALFHRLVVKDRLVRDGEWDRKNDYIGTNPQGKSIGFVGFGNIGREIARLLEPWEVTMRAYSRRRDTGMSGVAPAELDEVMRESDAVFIVCPLTNETRGLIGEDELAAMKPSAFLINLARGLIVDEAALLRALEDGRIAGAGLDVFDQEPLPHDHPFTKMTDNVVLAPHAIGHVTTLFDVAIDSVRAELAALRDGVTPKHLVGVG